MRRRREEPSDGLAVGVCVCVSTVVAAGWLDTLGRIRRQVGSRDRGHARVGRVLALRPVRQANTPWAKARREVDRALGGERLLELAALEWLVARGSWLLSTGNSLASTPRTRAPSTRRR